jgi:hypothetical protein
MRVVPPELYATVRLVEPCGSHGHRADQARGRCRGCGPTTTRAPLAVSLMPAARALARALAQVGRMSSTPHHLLGAFKFRSPEPTEELLSPVLDEGSADHRTGGESSDVHETFSMLDAGAVPTREEPSTSAHESSVGVAGSCQTRSASAPPMVCVQVILSSLRCPKRSRWLPRTCSMRATADSSSPVPAASGRRHRR